MVLRAVVGNDWPTRCADVANDAPGKCVRGGGFMRSQAVVINTLVACAIGALTLPATSVSAQGRGRGGTPTAPTTTPEVTAIRAGRLFDSKTGTMLNSQVV